MGLFVTLSILLAVSSTTLSEFLDLTTIYRLQHKEVQPNDSVPSSASAELHLRSNALGRMFILGNDSFPVPVTSTPQLRCSPVDTDCSWQKEGDWTTDKIKRDDALNSIGINRDPCQINNGGCQIYCKIAEFRPVCSCPSGYVLNPDQKTCKGSGTYNYIMTASSGGFSSPNHPNQYSNDMYVTWLLVAPVNHSIRLDIPVFSMQADNDFLRVYDGSDTSARIIAVYSSHVYNPLHSTGNIMLVTMTTSPQQTNTGFRAEYRREIQSKVSSGECQVLSTTSGSCSCPSGYNLYSDQKTCRGSSNRYLLTGTYGSFVSPSYPNTYSNGQFVTWLLIAPQQSTITLDIESFRTERGYDPLEVYDGPDTSFRKIGSYSGIYFANRIYSSGNKMFITFWSDGSNVYQGFSIKFTTEQVKDTVPFLTSNHGSLRSISFLPEDPLICLSVIYKIAMTNKIWITANLGHDASFNLTNNHVHENEGWKIGQFKGTLQPKQMEQKITLYIYFSGQQNSVLRIMGCNPFDDEDVYVITDSLDLDYIPEIVTTPYSDELMNDIAVTSHQNTSSLKRCFNGGLFVRHMEKCVCPSGFAGTQCQEACGPNSFGLDCGGMCSGFEQGCLGMVFCQQLLPCMCAPGFTGKYCNKKCEKGYYGASCRMPCGHCNGRTCNIYSGECDGGCEPGYSPPLCQETYLRLSQAPEITHRDYNSAELQAPLSFTGQGSVKFYQLQYKEKTPSDSSWLKLPPQESSSNPLQASMKNLKAGTHYVAQVILIDRDGNSNENIDVPVVEFQTPCTVPTSNEYHLEATEITSSTIKVSWKYETMNSKWCPLEGFEFIFKDRWRAIKLNATKRENFTFLNLLPGRTYKVLMKGLTEFGSTPLSSILSITTRNRAPAEVTNLQVSAKAPGEMLVSWTKPRFSNETISHYRVEFECLRLLGCSLSCGNSSGQLEVSVESVILTGLHPHAQYRIKVAGFTASLGPYKSVLGATQHSGASVAPGDSPTPITHKSNTSIAVQWTPPPNCAWLNGYLYGYRYELVSTASGDHILRTGSTTNTHINFTNLSPHTRYEVRIFVVTSGGSSTTHKLVIPVITRATAPEKVQNLTVYKRGRRMIGVRWAEPLESYGSIKSFIVTHLNKNKPSSTEVREEISPVHCTAWPDLFCHTINRLTPDSQYIVSVQARNVEVDTNGDASSVTTVTQELAPGPPIALRILNRTQNSMLVEWGPPFMINGVLRSFLVNVEEIDTSDPSTCCDYFPLQELPVRTEEQIYRLEVGGLNPASTLTISVSAKTVTMGPAVNITARTLPVSPSLILPPQLIHPSLDDDLFKIILHPSETAPGLKSTYLLLILPPEEKPDPVVWDKELQVLLKRAVNASFYPVAEFSSETLIEREELSLGTGAPQRNGSLAVLQDPVLTPGSYRAGLALVVDYFGSKSVGFAESDLFVVP